MNRKQYEALIDRANDTPSQCVNGHANCSDHDGGKCVDEEWRPEFEECFDSPRS